jgi:hypothetical protein
MNPPKAVEEIDGGTSCILYRLHLFAGNSAAILDRLPPSTGGIYAWFRHHKFSDDPGMLHKQLVAEVSKPRFAPRSGLINPYYQVTVASHTEISEGKEEKLKQFLQNPVNRNLLHGAFRASVLFQAPLYIGKAGNIRQRISTHLTPGSTLNNRFKEYGVDIYSTNLIIIPTPGPRVVSLTEEAIDKDEPEPETELILEEIFSRLFAPQLTLRLG